MLARERQGRGVRVRGLEACGLSIDMAGEDGGRRKGVGQCGEVKRGLLGVGWKRLGGL